MVSIRALRILLIATGLAFVALVVIMTGSKTEMRANGSLLLEYTPDTDGPEGKPHLISAHVVSNTPVTDVDVHYTTGAGFETRPLAPIDATDWWATTLPGQEKGVRTYYFLTAADSAGRRVTLPAEATEVWTNEYDYFKFRAEGRATRWALAVHIYLMLAAILLFIHALYYALCVMYGTDRSHALEWTVYSGVVAFFITGFPIGWMIEKQVLGNYWEGIPFGWDITDSKTLFIFAFWMIPVALHLRRRAADVTFARWVVVASIFTVAMFLLPHSL